MEVAAGTADAAIIDYVMSIGSIGEGTDYESLVVEGSGYAPENYGIAFRKGSDAVNYVNKAINELTADGTLTKIAEKYKLQDLLLGNGTYEEVKAIYDKYYKDEKFIRVLEKDVCPETKWVEGSNYVDINFVIDERTGRIVMMGALDNIVKGAAGQAVQNMNLMFGLPEDTGLRLKPSAF